MYRINVKSVDIYLGLHDKILTIATLGSVMSSNNVNNLAHSGASGVTAPSSATVSASSPAAAVVASSVAFVPDAVVRAAVGGSTPSRIGRSLAI